MSLHVLITGGAGYIGSVLTSHLLTQNYKVTVIDCFYFGQETLPVHPKLTCVQQDSRTICQEQLEGIDILIDLAAMSNDPCGEAFESLTWEVNHLARVRTANLAKQSGVKHYILPSSCSVYGYQKKIVDENSPTMPLTTYAKANLKAEEDIIPLGTNDFCVTALRLSTVFGYSPRMRLDLVVNSMTYNAWKLGEIVVHGGGTQYRPLVHTKDVSSAIIHIINAPSKYINKQIYNIGGQQLNCRINDIAEKIQAHMRKEGHSINIIHNGPQDLRSYRVSFKKLERLGWQPSHSLAGEIAKLIQRMNNGKMSIDSRCYTLSWYSHILDLENIVQPHSTQKEFGSPLNHASFVDFSDD